MKPSSQALKNKPSHDAQREFGGTLGESTRVIISFHLISNKSPRLIPNLDPPLRCSVYSHPASLDGSVPDLREPIPRGQCAPVAPSPALS